MDPSKKAGMEAVEDKRVKARNGEGGKGRRGDMKCVVKKWKNFGKRKSPLLNSSP